MVELVFSPRSEMLGIQSYYTPGSGLVCKDKLYAVLYLTLLLVAKFEVAVP